MKRLRQLLYALLGLELAYVLAALVVLDTAWGRRVVHRGPEKSWDLAWDRGWSIVPGRVHLSGPVFARDGRRADVRVTARHLSLRVSPWALTQRRFAARGIVARGLAVDVDRRPGEEAAVPEGDGRAPAAGRPWRVELRGIAAEVERFAFDDVEVRGGQGRLAGDVELEVRGEMAVERLELEWPGAVLRRGDAVLAEPLTLTYDGAISPFDPGAAKGWAVLDHLAGRIGVEGSVSRLAILRRLLSRAKWIETLDGRGDLRAALEVAGGRLAPGSEIEATADDLRLDFLGYAAAGSGTVRAEVSGGSPADRLARLAVTFDDYALRRPPAEVPHVRGRGLRVVATTAEADLRRGFSDLHVVIDMPRAEVPDMAVYSAFLPPELGFVLASGRGTTSLHLEASPLEESARGRLELAAEAIGGRFRDLDFSADLELSTRISGGDLDDFRLEVVDTRMAITDAVFRDGRNTEEEGWWMTVDVPRGTLHLGEERRITAEVDVLMKDTRALMALFAEVKAWLQRFERILTVRDVAASGRLVMEPQSLALRDLAIEGRKLRGSAQLDLGESGRSGILYLRYRGVAVGLELAGEERDWKLVNVRKWYERKEADWAASP